MAIAAEEKEGDLVQDHLQGALTAEGEGNIGIEATEKIEDHQIDWREGVEHRGGHEMSYQIRGQEVHHNSMSVTNPHMISSESILRGKTSN